jgi:hypothetical protein
LGSRRFPALIDRPSVSDKCPLAGAGLRWFDVCVIDVKSTSGDNARALRNDTPSEDEADLQLTVVVRSPDSEPDPELDLDLDSDQGLDPDPTVIVRSLDPELTQVVRRPSPPLDPEGTVIVRARRLISLADNNGPTEAIRIPARPVWRGSADIRDAQGDPDGTWSWTSWKVQRKSTRVWWLPIVIAVLGLLILFGFAFLTIRALENSRAAASIAPAVVVGANSGRSSGEVARILRS